MTITSRKRPVMAGRQPVSLPRDWKLVRVRDVGEVRLGRQRSPKNHNGPNMRPYLRVANVYEDRIDTSDVLSMNFTPQEYETYRLEVGDILLNEGQSKELVGRPAIYRGEVPGACFQNTLVRFRAYEGLLPEYALVIFRHYLHSGRFQEIATSTTNIAHLGAERFAELEFPLPPLAEQRRIVERVEALLAQAHTARAVLAPLPALVRRLRQSVLAAAFSGRLSTPEPGDEPAGELLERIRAERALLSGRKGREEARALPEGLSELPAGWAWARTHELAHIGTGATPHRKEKAKYYDGGTIPWVTSGALNKVYVEEVEEAITERAVAETNAKVFPKGTLLVAMYGEGRTRGLISELCFEAATNQACAALVFEGQALACKPFVKLFFQKNYDDIRRMSSGGVQPNLNLSIVGNTLIPFAPLAEQRRIVARVEALLAQVDVIEAVVDAVSQRITDIERAVLARAFRGELVEKDKRP